MTLRPIILLILCLFGTSVVEAAVSINEVAWMGGTVSANHEWIELSNVGTEAVVVDGWKLSDGMNLNISLAGTIAGGAYAVLERTSEESAPGTAFLLYTGALVNGGVTLVLTDASGGIVDQVAGGTDWKNIGGDNTTKETAQYSDKGWVTDVPTPGAVNASGRTVPPPATTTDSTTDTVVQTTAVVSTTSTRSSRGSGSAIPSLNPKALLKILPAVQSVAYVHQRIPLRASVSGLTKNSQPLVRFEWNFGDTHYATGTEVWHTYEYPGTYAVTTYARYGSDEQMSRHEITVLPVDVSLTHGPAGEVQLHNDAPYDIDISGYVLRGTKEVVFPPRSILLTRSTITVAPKRVGEKAYPKVALYDTKKNLVTATYLVESAITTSTATVPDTLTTIVKTGPTSLADALTTDFVFTVPRAEAGAMLSEQPAPEVIQILPDSEEVSLPKPPPRSQWPYYAFFVVLLLATGVVVTTKSVASAGTSDNTT